MTVRKSLDYHEIARRTLIADPLPQGTYPSYEHDIDVAVAPKENKIKKRRFEVIDRAVQKARQEIVLEKYTKLQAEIETMGMEIMPTLEGYCLVSKRPYDTKIDIAAEEDKSILGLSAAHNTYVTIGEANMATEKEIKENIKNLESLIGTGYYDDEAGDVLMKQVIVYLQSKLSKDK